MAEATIGQGAAPRPHPNEQPAPAPEALAVDPFSELRSLIVGPERRDLLALQAHVFDASVQTREVSRVLPDAIALRSHDPRLTSALAPSIEEAITSSVQRDPQPLADALFPVMGPAIRRAIEHMLESMMEAFNRSVEQSLSWRALQWRVTSWRTGRPFAEIVLLHTLQYRVEQLFLIHAETGLLLQHLSASLGEGQDADQMSAMLTAIRDFVRDSFKVGQADSLDAFRVGDLAITVEQGPYAILAAVVRGTAPHGVRVMFGQALESVHLQLGAELKGFKGDSAPFDRARPLLEACLVTQLRQQKRPAAYRRWAAVGALVLLAVGVWAFFSVRERRRWNAYLDRLAAQPGVVLLSSGRRSGKYFVAGLRDPLAGDLDALVTSARLAPASVESHWEGFQALYPPFVSARATDLLRPPSGVTLDYADGVLTASGAAPERWLIDSERMAPAIGGVHRFAYAGKAAQLQLKEKIEAVSILFAKGQSELPADQFAQISALTPLLAQLNEAVRVRGQRAQIELLGHTDNDGSDLANEPLSQARANEVLHLLQTADLDALSFSARGVGSTLPVATGATEAEKERNRRASFRVALADQSAPGSRP